MSIGFPFGTKRAFYQGKNPKNKLDNPGSSNLNKWVALEIKPMD
jgi:hypothetical protein